MRIYHNIPAIAAYNSLSKIVGGLEKSLSKLSTGLRVRGAADDAAGLAISEKMRVQVTGLDVAGRNAQDGISLIQTADGALQETTSMLMRMRELAIQGANDTMTQQDRRYLQLEIEQLKDDINRIATTTIFNKKRLLDGSSSVLWSSDDLNTRLFVRGGLRQIDQFGQKNVLEGNYKITINANPGAAEIQKSDIFKIKHKNVISDLRMDVLKINDVKIDSLPAGNYAVRGYSQVYTLTGGTNVRAGTFFISGYTHSAGSIFAAGLTYRSGASFAAGQVFYAGAEFAGGTMFSAGATFAAGTMFTAGTTATITAGATFAAGSVIGSAAANNAFVIKAGTTIMMGSNTKMLSADTTILALVGLTGLTANLANTRFTFLNDMTFTADFVVDVAANDVSTSVIFTTVAKVAADYTSAAARSITLGGKGVLGNQGILQSDYTARNVLTTNQEYTASRNMALSNSYVVCAAGALVVGSNKPVAVYQAFGLTTGDGLVHKYGLGISITTKGNSSTNLSTFSGTANILLEVKNVDTVSKIVTFKAIAQVLFADGSSQSFVVDDLQVKEGQGAAWSAFGVAGDFFTLDKDAITGAGYSVGDKMTLGVVGTRAAMNSAGSFVKISGTQNSEWGGYWASALQDMTFVLRSAAAGKDVHFRSFYLNTANGSVYESDISLSLNNNYSPMTAVAGADLASFKATYIGQTARLDTQLRDLDKFWNSEGRFLLDNPSRIEITQGDGTGTRITLYATDTIQDVQTKLNAAYELGLNQQYYLDNSVQNDSGKFVTFVTNATRNTSEAVAGTVVLRSVVNGMTGTVRLSGDEDIIKALSLNIIQEARENQFFVSIQDAHSGETIVSNQKISGNLAVGLLHPNLDFEFRSDADMSTVWNDVSKKYDTQSKDSSTYETVIHIADNSVVFQIGANESEDMGVDIGDMTTRAIGIHRVLVTDIGSAQRSITMVDMALDKISAQRARLGAYQNRLEHTITNLSVAAENLTASESRIRDLDIAREMMHYTKTNILLQSGTAMLSQANQLPKSVMELLR